MNGWEVIAKIKADPALRGIPVVILTTSRTDQEIPQYYALSASCNDTKPADVDQFNNNVNSIKSLWLTIVTPRPRT